MGRINVLSFELANLIAAGEVVERPASVLKELIENSIDSGATQIVAEIKRGGVSLIRVTDNGCGIEREDLPVALKRHATSKIKEKDDLESIATLGFRGEALAAISSVSQMTIITKTSSSDVAYMLTADAGNVTEICEVGASDGTTVVVENLFYNVPARRKFLKKDSTEAMNVVALVEKVALSRPDISIQMLVDGEQRFKTMGDGNLQNTVYSVLGKEFSTKLIHADAVANGIHAYGFIGRSDNVRKNRNLQNVFINGRYVKSLTAMAAIEKAYTSYIAPECFPVCVLFIDMPPSFVDVNVHPAKLEVKFSDERIVFETVYYTVKDALEKHVYRPEMKLENKGGFYNPAAAFVPIGADTRGTQISADITKNDIRGSETHNRSDSPQKLDLGSPMRLSSGASNNYSAQKSYNEAAKKEFTPSKSLEILNIYKKSDPSDASTSSANSNDENKTVEKTSDISIDQKKYKIIGEAFDCYVLVEDNEGLLVVDKHAAHERVIFEDLKKRYNNDGRVASQSLLLPITLRLSPDEIATANDYKQDFLAIGFDFIQNGIAIDLLSIPDAISASGAETLFASMLDELQRGKGNPNITEAIRREKALYQIACKAAIKGGRIYDRALIEWLISKLFELPDIIVCPHGRPVAFRLTKRELDRQFDRIK